MAMQKGSDLAAKKGSSGRGWSENGGKDQAEMGIDVVGEREK